jgi:hypothetical protein
MTICPFSGGEEARLRPYGNQKIEIGKWGRKFPTLVPQKRPGRKRRARNKDARLGHPAKNSGLETGHYKPGQRQDGDMKSPLQGHKHRSQQGQISTSD